MCTIQCPSALTFSTSALVSFSFLFLLFKFIFFKSFPRAKLDRVDLTGYPPQADLCSNPQYLTGTTRSTTTVSTRISTSVSTTANGGGGGGGGGGVTTRPPATITNPTIATKTYYPINPNGYIYCLSKSSHLHANDHILKLLFAAITLIFYKLIF